MKVLDWYNHQGHQYEFFKLGFDFFLTTRNLRDPKWNTLHRPLNDNVIISNLERLTDVDFDVVMYRTGCDETLVKKMQRRGAKIIYVAQMTFKPEIALIPDAMVWNCRAVMRKFKKHFNCKHYDIVHGYDPEEFKPIDVEKNGRILTLANSFKKRGDLLGYDMWKNISNYKNNCDVFGHDNEDIGAKRIETFGDQLRVFSEYSAYLNTTLHSAMPRSRAEAMMCGMPLITTKNYGIEDYIKNDECIYIHNHKDAINSLKHISNLDFSELSKKSRDVAIREFSIDKYLKKWKSVFSNL